MNILQVGGNLFICEGTELGKVDLQNAKVDGQIHLGGAKFSGALVMNQIQVGDDLIIGEDTFIEDLALRYAKVRGGLDFSRAVIQGSLDLRGCSVDFFLDNQIWPKTYNINGFSYRKIEHKMAIRKNEWFENWLINQAEFSQKPYELLTQLLKDDGYKTKADAIGFSGKQYYLRHINWRNLRQWPQGLLLLLQLIFVGYGYKMYFPIFWVVGLTLLGTIYLQISSLPEGIPLTRFFEKVFFTLDTLLPIIELDPEYKKIITKLPGAIRYPFFVIEIFGWIIGSFLVAGLSGLTKK